MAEDKKNNAGFQTGFLGDMLKDLQDQLKNEKKGKGRQGNTSRKPSKEPLESSSKSPSKEPLESSSRSPSKEPLESSSKSPSKEPLAGSSKNPSENKPAETQRSSGRFTALPLRHEEGAAEAGPGKGLQDQPVKNGDNFLNMSKVPPLSDMTGFHPGSMLLDTYRIESAPVMGGMGSVWRVHHTGWDVDLAMKRPRPEAFRTERQKNDFSNECDCWINLGLHPNIVSCYYVREIEGIPTIFSEWMENGSLGSHIKAGTLYSGTKEEVRKRLLDIAIQFARGLHYAHENSLIHQDVKPDNLLLTTDWAAKVSDFGLAKAMSVLSSPGEAATELEMDSDATMVSPAGGKTPTYCSPEQAAGQLLTRRTDIFSWAVSVMEMYLGHKPWAHGRTLTGPLAGAACRDYFAMCTERPIPEALQELLAQCMRQNPDDRPRDFAVIETALKEIYENVTSCKYLRPEPKAAAETATNLNNRALSYLDLGKEAEAENLLKQAIRKEPDNFYANYNYDLFQWNRGRLSDKTFHDDLFRLQDDCMASSVARAKLCLCTRKDMKEAEKCLESLKRWNVPPTTEEELFQSMERWRQCDPGQNSHDDYLPAPGFSADFPALEVIPGQPLRILEKKTGRVLKEMDVASIYYDKTYYICNEKLDGYTPEGMVLLNAYYEFYASLKGKTELKSTSIRKSRVPLPDPAIPFYFEPAVIEEQRQREAAEQQGETDYMAAKSAWDAGQIDEAFRILNNSLKRRTLTLHEPSMKLWTQLGAFYKKGKLVAVVPTEDPASEMLLPEPDPSRICHKTGDIFNYGWMCISCDGVTELTLDCSRLDTRDTLNLNTEADFVFRITGRLIPANQEYFVIDPFFKETADDDGGPFPLYQIRMKEPGKIELWSQYQPSSVRDYSGTTAVRFTLPGGCYLQNYPEGVDIGGIRFDDKFTEFRPLFDADIIPCQKHNYRLIYEYDGLKEN